MHNTPDWARRFRVANQCLHIIDEGPIDHNKSPLGVAKLYQHHNCKSWLVSRTMPKMHYFQHIFQVWCHVGLRLTLFRAVASWMAIPALSECFRRDTSPRLYPQSYSECIWTQRAFINLKKNLFYTCIHLYLACVFLKPFVDGPRGQQKQWRITGTGQSSWALLMCWSQVAFVCLDMGVSINGDTPKGIVYDGKTH